MYPELIPDVPTTEVDWFRRTGIYPIHGLVVVRTELLWKRQWVARALCDAFVEAKKAYIAHLKGRKADAAEEEISRPDAAGRRSAAARASANMPSIEAMLTYGLQQKLGLSVSRRPSLDAAAR